MDETVKVLVIEDDPSMAEMYRLRLVGDGYDVVVGCDGEEGLQLAVDENPDFIYLDLRLPKLDGFEVLERLRAEPATAHIPVIILSNYGDPEMRERGLRTRSARVPGQGGYDATATRRESRTDDWDDGCLDEGVRPLDGFTNTRGSVRQRTN